MQPKINTTSETSFRQDVFKGFTDYPKHISSKYFYDARGDRLFQKIMAMSEYYLTNCEFDILDRHKERICNQFIRGGDAFSLIELGAGDGKKTKILLRHLLEKKAGFTYRPVDISKNALLELEDTINRELPAVAVAPVLGTYFESLEALNAIRLNRKVILFLGSNIGNLLHPKAIEFLRHVRALMSSEDFLFVGFDHKKHPKRILDAYNDATGITEAFNKNVLARINREFGGTFDLDNFLHWEVYDPETGTAKSYLVARKQHTVRIEALDLTVSFKAWETIHTEISQKYDDSIVEWLAVKAGLVIVDQYSDTDNAYKNYLFRKA